MYFVISASEVICGCDVGIGTMQSLIVVEGNIRAYDYLSMILIEILFEYILSWSYHESVHLFLYFADSREKLAHEFIRVRRLNI